MILALILGLGGGVVSGLLGVGGGILFVPALTLALSLSQVKAEATSLLAIIPVALVGAVRQHRYGNVDVRDGLIVGVLAAAGAVVGVELANLLAQRVLRLAFAALTLFVAAGLIRRALHERGYDLGGMSESATGAEGAGEAHERAPYSVSSLTAIGEGYGFRKIRHELGVTAFGINAIVLPPAYATGIHYHDEQEETYFVHQGEVEFRFGDGSTHVVGPGGVVRVDPHTPRGMRNVSDTEDATVVIVGGRDGYVGRDGRAVGKVSEDGPPGAA